MDLSTLNAAQKQGVTTNSKYTRIIAGAGSGKTRVLAYRIAYLLDQNLANPSGVLGITFTNKAALEIKNRVASLVGNVAMMSLCTIHSWCARFLRMECHHISYPKNFTILDEEDTLLIMKDVFASYGRLRSDPLIKKCLNWISKKKTEGFQYDDIKDEEYPNQEMRDFKNFFHDYQAKLTEQHAFDFDDLLLKTIEILSDEENGVAKAYRKNITHILVDEFQDINDVQFHLITLLMSPDCELYVVGDPDQTIYTWRGANQRIIMNFEKNLKALFQNVEVETIILNQNYRSTKNILITANHLIDHNIDRVKKDLIAVNDEGDMVTHFSGNHSSDEASYVVNTIKELHHENVFFHDIAILYRANYLTRELETQLNFHRIPYRIYGGLKFFQRKEIKDVLAFLTLLVNPQNDISFKRIMNVPHRQIGQKSVDILVQGAHESAQSLYLYVLEENTLPLPKAKALALKQMVQKMEKTKMEMANSEPGQIPELLKNMLQNLDYEKELDEDPSSKEDRKENIEEFFRSMEQYFAAQNEPTFEEFLSDCILQSSQDEVVDGDFVTLMTVHTAKGLEFDYVFVYGLCEGIFPSRKAIEESNKGLEEERRLAYVAFTRAKKRLFLSSNQDYAPMMGQKLRASRFIKESGLQIFENQKQYDTKNIWEEYRKRNAMSGKGNIMKKNNVSHWEVGDKVVHDTFGSGVVEEVKDSLIVVHFDNEKFNRKTLIASHFMIHKV